MQLPDNLLSKDNKGQPLQISHQIQIFSYTERSLGRKDPVKIQQKEKITNTLLPFIRMNLKSQVVQREIVQKPL